MAQFEIYGLDEVIEQMKAMGMLTGNVADAMLLAGAEMDRQVWVKVAESYPLRLSGDMIGSIGFSSRPVSVADAKHIDIYPLGVGSDGMRNATKAYWLHYAPEDHEGSGWIDKVDELAGEPVGNAMVKVWDEFLRTGKVPDAVYPEVAKVRTSDIERAYDRKRNRHRNSWRLKYRAYFGF